MKFKYNGDKASIKLYDLDFEKGRTVEVPDDAIAYVVRKRLRPFDRDKVEIPVLIVDKLQSNPDFEVVKAGRPRNDVN